MNRIGATDLEVFPLCLGASVFGWTADEKASFAVLDAYADAGGNFIDTADVYSSWVPGNVGGESERIIGRWLAGRSDRARFVIATKVGLQAPHLGLAAASVRPAVEACLARLGVSAIDLCYAHRDDEGTPQAETLATFDALVREGKIRHLGASNFSAPRLASALAISERHGFAKYVAVQPHYNLLDHTEYESATSGLCGMNGLACFPYYALASGFLTGKYRPGKTVETARGDQMQRRFDARGRRILDALDAFASRYRTTPSAIALRWLAEQWTVTAPIASARTTAQLAEQLAMLTVTLTNDDLAVLRAAAS